MSDEHDHDAELAAAIVAEAQRRALGGNRAFRQIGAVLWASFLGATASLTTLLLLPGEGWLPLDTPPKLALAFVVLWLLAIIPALVAAVLAAPAADAARGGDDHGTR